MNFRVTIFTLAIIIPVSLTAQSSVFELGVNLEKQADRFVEDGSYQEAVSYYERCLQKSQQPSHVRLKLARTNFKMHRYEDAAKWFLDCDRNSLTNDDLFMLGDALVATRRYDDAVTCFSDYLKKVPDNEWANRRIWRIRNLNYLLEDSLQYSIRNLPINSPGNDFGAVPVGDEILFVSNFYYSAVQSVDPASQSPFYKLFSSKRNSDGANELFSDRVMLPRPLRSKFHNGPFCLYDSGRRMVLTSSSKRQEADGGRPLHLFFAKLTNGKWQITGEFPHNDAKSSATDPFITPDGNTLYFSSDRKGGFGGRDLYRCELKDGVWQKPVNLGPVINTPFDEGSPHVSENILYFSSNGHAGLGGVDIFKVDLSTGALEDVVNMGFPLNSSSDDFGLLFSETGYRGYFTSSRGDAGDDNIYEFQMDQQTYPLLVHGVVKQKTNLPLSADSLHILAGATLFLIDHSRNVTVEQTTSDDDGRFSFSIPYFSFYRIKVVQPDGTDAVVTLEIPRKKQDDWFHEIVIVNDAFLKPVGEKYD